MAANYISEFQTKLFGLLNEKAEYAVLRNYDGLPEYNQSRDIDIIIERKVYNRIKYDLLDLVDKSKWKVVTLLKSDRLVTWVCGHISDDGAVDLIQLDFFFNTSVFGVMLMPAADFLRTRKFNGRIYHVDKACEFLDKYLYDRAVGAVYPDKYQAVKEAVAGDKNVTDILQSVFGINSVEVCDKTSGRKLLMHAFGRTPVASFCRFLKFEYFRVKNYLCSNTGFSIGFTGPDGVGKTTVIDRMVESFGDVFRTAHVYYHFRPMLFGNIGEVAHSAGLKKEVDRNYSDPHRGGKTGKLNSFLRLLYYSADYILGYWTKIKSVTRITRLVIFDRYYTDIICDSRRSRIHLSPKFLYWFGRIFIPSLDYNILLTARTETILSRKQELDAAGVETINRNIDYLTTKKGYYKVMNETTPDDAVRQILSFIFDQQHKKNIKRLR